MAKANRKFRENDLFGRNYKVSIPPTKRIRKLEKQTKEEKRRIRRAINRMKQKVEE